MTRSGPTLTELARAGFGDLRAGRELLAEASAALNLPVPDLLQAASKAADPDQAVRSLIELHERHPDEVTARVADPAVRERLVRVLGASAGLADFLLRHPEQLSALETAVTTHPTADELRADLARVVGAESGSVAASGDEQWNALRVRYRWHLTRLAAWDLEQAEPAAAIGTVTAVLSDLAGAALDASLAVARHYISADGPGPGHFSPADVQATRLGIIGMGKAGARELNYVSDVDVIFVAEAEENSDVGERYLDIATRLAVQTMRGIAELGVEPPLWEVDANLRPEGKEGALVRSLASHEKYYDRWADSWEFQALLKARAFAGDRELAGRFVTAVAPKVWNSASRENFVESVQRMRERVTENIPADEVPVQLKLGPGGLRDIEFTVQLLQLVHGQTDDRVRQAGTLDALAALAEHGYIGRAEAVQFTEDYRLLRLLEHRLQLERLRRTHLMPRDEASLRVLARATGLATSASGLTERWNQIARRVRGLHERLFYRPLLSAVAALPEEDLNLSSEQASARLAAIGFRNPTGALAHIAAMTAGVSRRATIQRHLLPVMLQWFAQGADPDYGLLAFRRLSDNLGQTHWFLGMLRDSSGAAMRLTRVLSGSRFVGELLERIPEASAWLESEAELRPRSLAALQGEAKAIIARHEGADAAARSLRAVRRREILRLAFASILGLATLRELAAGLTDLTSVLLDSLITVIRRDEPDGRDLEFAVIGMGRYGGAELGFGSDADVLYVYRSDNLAADDAQARAERLVAQLQRMSTDPGLPLELDADLRPEGRNGPVVRSLKSYRSYYERWSLTWEAQALLRARAVAGDDALRADFERLADEVRYPHEISERDVREVKRIKARVENERLPQGIDPSRHLKLGRGSLSDVEWFVQLIQLQHAAELPDLRTTSTLDALDAAEGYGLVADTDADKLRRAWIFTSQARSALTLWTNKTSDVLPADRQQLDGLARLVGYPPGQATRFEEDYMAITRRARAVFEKHFYGVNRTPPSTPR